MSLTVKLVEVVHNALHRSATRVCTLEEAHLLRLSLVKFEDQSDGHKEARRNDSEGSDGPAPCATGQIGICRQWCGEGGNDEGCRDECPRQGAILETRRVGDEDV